MNVGPVARLFDLYCDGWHRRAEARAWQDPEWAAIERRRVFDYSSDMIRLLDEDFELSMTEWEHQDDIFARINPRPLLVQFGMWWRYETGKWIIRPNMARSYLQRARHGYSDRDTWSLNGYLIDVIAGSVERFAELDNGHPAQLQPEEWIDILNRISGGLRSAAQRLDSPSLDDTSRARAEAELDESFQLLRHWLPHLWW